jgi:hypothetical protein
MIVAEPGPDVDPLRLAEKDGAISRSAPIASKARGLGNAGHAKENARGAKRRRGRAWSSFAAPVETIPDERTRRRLSPARAVATDRARCRLRLLTDRGGAWRPPPHRGGFG